MLVGIAIFAQLTILARAPIDTAQPIVVHAAVAPETVYVGQQATYEVGVFIDAQMRLRLRRNPEFVPPEPQGMLAYDLPAPDGALPVRRVGAHSYETHAFRRAFFPLTPGRYEIPHAQLVYALPLSLSFFSREETRTLLAEGLSIIARPLPPGPAEYTGAVGDLRLDAAVDSTQARVGNPLILTVRVAGRGNVPLFPRPVVSVAWGTLVAAQERVHLDSTASDVRGSKDFDWLLTPRDSGHVTLPAVRYPYFNPYTERYEIALTEPETLHVRPGAIVRSDTAGRDTVPLLAVRTLYRGTPDPPLFATSGFLAIALAAPVIPLGIVGWRRGRRPRRRVLSPALRLQALARRGEPVDVTVLRRTLVRALDERFDLGPTALTDRGALARALRREGVTRDASAEAESVLALLDARSFGRQASALRRTEGAMVSGDLCARACSAYVAVAEQARPREGGTRGAGLSVAMVIAAAASGAALQAPGPSDSPDAREFHSGVAAYAGRQFADAATHFGAATELAPGAPDAWANAGTAAWALGDTEDAVVGWQRAGRLEPIARDMHDDLARVRAPQDGPLAMLPALPAAWPANAALALWLLACALATRRALRGMRRALISAGAAAAVTGAIGLAAVAHTADAAAAARDLAVVGPATTLYAGPSLVADRSAQLDAGDIARMVERDRAWSHIHLDGGREGWVELARLTSLARRPYADLQPSR
jgi:hypothetical protein